MVVYYIKSSNLYNPMRHSFDLRFESSIKVATLIDFQKEASLKLIIQLTANLMKKSEEVDFGESETIRLFRSHW